MRILLVYCNSMLENALPISISQLTACLKNAGFEVDLFDTTFYRWGYKSDTENRIEALQIRPCPIWYYPTDVYSDFVKKIESFGPDIIGISVVEPTFNFGIRLLASAQKVMRSNGIRVVLGGVHAMLAPETVAKFPDLIDFICVSEGEKAFVELCHKLERGHEVKHQIGFWVRRGDQWLRNGHAPLVELNELPNLDFSLFSLEYLNKPIMGRVLRTISIETTRGCPYRCSYCSDYALTRLRKEQGHWFRQKTIEKVMAELEEHVANYDPEFVYIMSDSFLAGPYSRVKGFFDEYKKFSIPFWFNTRPEDITPEKVRLVKESGGMRVSIGIESGNEEFRKKVLHRNVSNEQILRAAQILHDFDISFSVNIILGLPDETREMVFDSIELCRKVKADGVSTHIFNPYHGTELRDVSVRKGYIDPELIADDFFQGYWLRGSALSQDEVLGLFRTIPLYVTFPKEEFCRIEKAEKLDAKGDEAFARLREEFYQRMGW